MTVHLLFAYCLWSREPSSDFSEIVYGVPEHGNNVKQNFSGNFSPILLAKNVARPYHLQFPSKDAIGQGIHGLGVHRG